MCQRKKTLVHCLILIKIEKNNCRITCKLNHLFSGIRFRTCGKNPFTMCGVDATFVPASWTQISSINYISLINKSLLKLAYQKHGRRNAYEHIRPLPLPQLIFTCYKWFEGGKSLWNETQIRRSWSVRILMQTLGRINTVLKLNPEKSRKLLAKIFKQTLVISLHPRAQIFSNPKKNTA